MLTCSFSTNEAKKTLETNCMQPIAERRDWAAYPAGCQRRHSTLLKSICGCCTLEQAIDVAAQTSRSPIVDAPCASGKTLGRVLATHQQPGTQSQAVSRLTKRDEVGYVTHTEQRYPYLPLPYLPASAAA